MFWDDELGDEESVGAEGATEDAAGFEIAGRVGSSNCEEALAEVRGYEYRAEGSAVFEVGGGFEGKFGRVEDRGWGMADIYGAIALFGRRMQNLLWDRRRLGN